MMKGQFVNRNWFIVPGRYGCNLKCVNVEYNLRSDIFGIEVNITLKSMPVVPFTNTV